jgi:hypothetical protein
MPYHYDPNQPRVRQGNPDGGQWTRDDAIHPAFLQTIPHIVRGAQQAGTAISKALEAGLALYTFYALRNSDKKKAVITFKAREYENNEGIPALASVRMLSREHVDLECKRLGRVQELTDEAVQKIRADGLNLTPAQFGTAVHTYVKHKVDTEEGPYLKAEKSELKFTEETRGSTHPNPADLSNKSTDEKGASKKKEVHYGQRGSIRVDVLELTDNMTVCVYDVKTGQKGLTPARFLEITRSVARAYPGYRNLIITEVRPTGF